MSRARDLLHWLSSFVIQDVPEEISHCQFDCPVNECERERWRMCEARMWAEEHASTWREDHTTQ